MSEISIPYTQINADSAPLCYAYEGDAGLDLRSAVSVTLEPFQRALIPTGVAFAIPQGYAGLVIPRSGLAAKHGISIVNAPGLIDSGYRGEIKVTLINLDPNESFSVNEGDRIAQIMFTPFAYAQLQHVSSLEASERGDQGFGSSGK